VTNRARVIDLSRFLELASQISGPRAFSVTSLILATTFVTLNRISVIAFEVSDLLIYVASAVILSQMIAFVVLIFAGKGILQVTNLAVRTTLVITAYFVATILANEIIKLLFQSWNIDQISPPTWQIMLNIIFTTLIFLGFSWVGHFISGNLYQVTTAREIVDELFRERQRLIQIINDGRNFAGRELSLEVEASRAAIELCESKYEIAESDLLNFASLNLSLSKIEESVRDKTKALPNRASGLRQISGKYNSLSFMIDNVKRENSYLPISMAVISLFGLGTWLGYFVDTRSVLLWGSALSLIGYVGFWMYLKLLAPKLLRFAVVFRVIFFELFLIFYLFFWLLLLGFIAGDNSTSYSVALVNAIIPFLLFNGASVIGGILNSTQIYRTELLTKASELRISLMELETLRAHEADSWKSLFAGDIAYSPTTASVMLQDLIVTQNELKVHETLLAVVAIWKTVESKLPVVMS